MLASRKLHFTCLVRLRSGDGSRRGVAPDEARILSLGSESDVVGNIGMVVAYPVIQEELLYATTEHTEIFETKQTSSKNGYGRRHSDLSLSRSITLLQDSKSGWADES